MPAMCHKRRRAVRPADPNRCRPLPRGPFVDSRSRVSPQTNAATFAIPIGIFQNAENAVRIVQELRGGGYPVYTTETSLRSGKRAVAVFLGPYGEQARAEQDLQRTRQMPEFGGSRVIQVPQRAGRR